MLFRSSLHLLRGILLQDDAQVRQELQMLLVHFADFQPQERFHFQGTGLKVNTSVRRLRKDYDFGGIVSRISACMVHSPDIKRPPNQ